MHENLSPAIYCHYAPHWESRDRLYGKGTRMNLEEKAMLIAAKIVYENTEEIEIEAGDIGVKYPVVASMSLTKAIANLLLEIRGKCLGEIEK
jgi:hypothetical protein